ncbi:MAG: hypothetical protein AB7V39_23875 [Nitrospiraceae bacterium]
MRNISTVCLSIIISATLAGQAYAADVTGDLDVTIRMMDAKQGINEFINRIDLPRGPVETAPATNKQTGGATEDSPNAGQQSDGGSNDHRHDGRRNRDDRRDAGNNQRVNRPDTEQRANDGDRREFTGFRDRSTESREQREDRQTTTRDQRESAQETSRSN